MLPSNKINKVRTAKSARKENASRELVPVYYQNQDDAGGPYQIITRAEARILKQEDKGRFICNGTKFRLHQYTPIIPLKQDRQRPTVNSCCGISKDEMLANAEVCDSDLEIIKGKQKVKAYPHTYDKQAILAHGYWNYDKQVSLK